MKETKVCKKRDGVVLTSFDADIALIGAHWVKCSLIGKQCDAKICVKFSMKSATNEPYSNRYYLDF